MGRLGEGGQAVSSTHIRLARKAVPRPYLPVLPNCRLPCLPSTPPPGLSNTRPANALRLRRASLASPLTLADQLPARLHATNTSPSPDSPSPFSLAPSSHQSRQACVPWRRWG